MITFLLSFLLRFFLKNFLIFFLFLYRKVTTIWPLVARWSCCLTRRLKRCDCSVKSISWSLFSLLFSISKHLWTICFFTISCLYIFFLRCVHCFATRPHDPHARFCTECGKSLPQIPQNKLATPSSVKVYVLF